MARRCCQISLCGRDPFSLHASHHCLESHADLLTNDPLPFHFTEDYPIPADFQPFLPVLTAGTHLYPGPLINLSSRSTRLSQALLTQLCSHKTQILGGKTSSYTVIPFLVVTSWCSMYFFFFFPSSSTSHI